MGTWDEEPQSPHNNRFVHFDGQLGIGKYSDSHTVQLIL